MIRGTGFVGLGRCARSVPGATGRAGVSARLIRLFSCLGGVSVKNPRAMRFWLLCLLIPLLVCSSRTAISFGSELRMRDLEERARELERALREANRPRVDPVERASMPVRREMNLWGGGNRWPRGAALIDPGSDRAPLSLKMPSLSLPVDSIERPDPMLWSHRRSVLGEAKWRGRQRAEFLQGHRQARLVANAPVVRAGVDRGSYEALLETVSLEDVNRFVFRRNRAAGDATPGVRAGGGD